MSMFEVWTVGHFYIRFVSSFVRYFVHDLKPASPVGVGQERTVLATYGITFEVSVPAPVPCSGRSFLNMAHISRPPLFLLSFCSVPPPLSPALGQILFEVGARAIHKGVDGFVRHRKIVCDDLGRDHGMQHCFNGVLEHRIVLNLAVSLFGVCSPQIRFLLSMGGSVNTILIFVSFNLLPYGGNIFLKFLCDVSVALSCTKVACDDRTVIAGNMCVYTRLYC